MYKSNKEGEIRGKVNEKKGDKLLRLRNSCLHLKHAAEAVGVCRCLGTLTCYRCAVRSWKGSETREGTRTGADCKQKIKTQRCKIPCNWKKQFGGECKYDFQLWGECDANTGLKTRTGLLKRALPDADCLTTVSATKPCGKTKTKIQGSLKPKRGEKKKEQAPLD
ncbi:hypothetical protein HF521_001141 [Silurus meridionalis]|uniref:Pleiotrophin n=1 Tax=Silurus meridionalis TaxID=175797 RepID=A0A8T0BAC5_SILME|nr:hypothetical protein HF521_001141 [Silurus meridionalis]